MATVGPLYRNHVCPSYVFGAEVDALALVDAIDGVLGLPVEGHVSSTYAHVMAHPGGGQWAVPADRGGISTEVMRAEGQLPEGTPAPVLLDTSWLPE